MEQLMKEKGKQKIVFKWQYARRFERNHHELQCWHHMYL